MCICVCPYMYVSARTCMCLSVRVCVCLYELFSVGMCVVVDGFGIWTAEVKLKPSNKCSINVKLHGMKSSHIMKVCRH